MSTFGWDTRAGYARFLQVQHAARLPIERWIAQKCPKNLQTPAQAELLEADIAALGLTIFTPPRAFKLAAGAEPTGAVWALAGSSLGNAMMLKSLMQGADAASLPTAFLSDTSMHAFWRSLLPALMRVPDQALADASCEGAQAVFDHFLRTAQAFQQRLAA
ncbi:biliverdin-producing heme oxygenase [Altererythrobacter sp. GH1-8]|uniref:biliverdin-producing heme oxygenase n=1 Tax=Altererythrobacter sp. GH1-8 TaxID=3349333 RepID=UPI00374CF477